MFRDDGTNTPLTKSQQLEANISKLYDNWMKWGEVLLTASWDVYHKTEKEVEALCNYFEGRYEEACNCRQFVV